MRKPGSTVFIATLALVILSSIVPLRAGADHPPTVNWISFCDGCEDPRVIRWSALSAPLARGTVFVVDRINAKVWKYRKEARLQDGLDESDASITVRKSYLTLSEADAFGAWLPGSDSGTIIHLRRDELPSNGSPRSPLADFTSTRTRNRFFDELESWLESNGHFASAEVLSTRLRIPIKGFSVGHRITKTAHDSRKLRLTVEYENGSAMITIDIESKEVEVVTATDSRHNHLPLNSDGSHNTDTIAGFEVGVPAGERHFLDRFLNNYRGNLEGEKCELACTRSCDDTRCLADCSLQNTQYCY